jgi:hypothetical protein
LWTVTPNTALASPLAVRAGGKTVSRAPFHFVCVAADHAAPASDAKGRAYLSPVTVYQGKWAYCAAGLVSKHDWRAISPTSREELKRRTERPAEKA